MNPQEGDPRHCDLCAKRARVSRWEGAEVESWDDIVTWDQLDWAISNLTES